jgi:hypothetical protein
MAGAGAIDGRRHGLTVTAALLFCYALMDTNVAEGSQLPDGIRPVQLVRKPAFSQGQLELTDEGISILQNLTARASHGVPFACQLVQSS